MEINEIKYLKDQLANLDSNTFNEYFSGVAPNVRSDLEKCF